MQSDVIKVLFLGDHHAIKSYLHRLVFSDEVNFPEDEGGDTSSFQSSTFSLSYLIDDKKCYTLQLCEAQTEEDLHNSNAANLPSSELIVIAYDISLIKANLASLQKQLKLNNLNCPLLILLAKNTTLDIVKPEERSESDQIILEEQEIAESMGCVFVEYCPVTGEGVKEAAFLMVHLAVSGQKKNKKKRYLPLKKKQETRQKYIFPEGLVIDPSGNFGMENSPKCPGVNVLGSTCVEDLARMKNDVACLDVRFTFPNDPMSPIDAHQVILVSAAPELFQDIFTGTTKSQISGRHHELFEKVSWPLAKDQITEHRLVEIRVSERVPRHEFVRFIEFLYVGASIADLRKSDDIHDLLTIAKTFNLSELLEACENVLEGNEMENIVKPSFVGGGQAKVLKELFFDKPLLDDLVFQLQGVLIYAHQAVIMARSAILAEKISYYRRDNPGCVRVKIEISDVSVETFKRFLEYLYTDDVSRSVTFDVLVELLGYATESNIPRLVTLCEYHLILCLSEDTDCEKVLEVFIIAKQHNAHQLKEWCRSLIARNFVHFKTCTQYKLLNAEDKDSIEYNQWPQKCLLSDQNELILEHYITDHRGLQSKEACCHLM